MAFLGNTDSNPCGDTVILNNHSEQVWEARPAFKLQPASTNGNSPVQEAGMAGLVAAHQGKALGQNGVGLF